MLYHFVPHTAPPSSLPPPFSVPPPGLRTSTSAGHDVAAMAAMLGGLRPPDGPFPNFPLPPPGFPPPFHPQLPGSEFRPRPPFHGGPPPFPLLPGGPLDVPGMLPPHLDDRGLPIHPDIGLPGMYVHLCIYMYMYMYTRQCKSKQGMANGGTQGK